MGTAAYGGANEDNWKQLSSDPNQRFIVLGGKVRWNETIVVQQSGLFLQVYLCPCFQVHVCVCFCVCNVCFMSVRLSLSVFACTYVCIGV